MVHLRRPRQHGLTFPKVSASSLITSYSTQFSDCLYTNSDAPSDGDGGTLLCADTQFDCSIQTDTALYCMSVYDNGYYETTIKPLINCPVYQTTTEVLTYTTPVTVTKVISTPVGTTSTCYEWHVIVSDDSCTSLQDNYGISWDEVRLWNPSINSLCDNLVFGDSYCVSGPPISTAILTAPVASTPSGTTSLCSGWHTILSYDSCTVLQDNYGVLFDDLRLWNPSINILCNNLIVGDDYCVRGPLETTST